MPRFRFTIRRMMVAVAIVAACLWGERMRRISLGHRRTADRYASAAAISRVLVTSGPSTPEGWAETLRKWEQQEDRIKERNVAMQGKYERAARYPWLPVEPEPPEPERD